MSDTINVPRELLERITNNNFFGSSAIDELRALLQAPTPPVQDDAKDALIAKLTAGLNEAKYRIEQGRVWNGMGYTFTGLHPHAQQQAIEAIDAAMEANK